MGRPLNDYEAKLLGRALAARGITLNHLEVLSCSDVEDIAPDDKAWHHIRLTYAEFPWRGSGYTVLADWSAPDLDGRIIELLVLADEHGRPYELEIRRPDLQPILHLPAVEKWA